jgi:A118 family predicted phage portal protein
MLEKIISWLRSVKDRMFGRTNFSAATLPQTAITDDMAAAIDRWVALYYNQAPWLNSNRLSLGLPAAIAREIATLVTLEAKVNVGDGSGGETLSPRAQFVADSLKPVLEQLAVQTEYACAFGGIAFRPYLDGDRVAIDCINADNFYPVSFNSRGETTGAIFVEKKREGKDTYIRVEEHAMLGDGVYKITNRAFKSENNVELGKAAPLTDVDEWHDLAPEVTLEGVESPLFAYFRIPNGNVINVDSPLGVSVYARADAAGLLQEADKQFQRLSWEYEGGEMAIDASIDAFKRDANGDAVLPAGKARLFRTNELSANDPTDGKFRTFAPTLRDTAYADGLNRLLMRVEDTCGLARGTFSDANETARTATELRISRQRTYATVTAIQMALQSALDKLAQAVDVFATLYNLAPVGEFDISYTWDDSIVVDAAAERDSDRQDVMDGIMQNWEYRMKWYGETEAQAKERVVKAPSILDRLMSDDGSGSEG